MQSKIDAIIKTYENCVKSIDNEATLSQDRAYGGIIRASKGNLTERIGREMIYLAWEKIGGNRDALNIDKKKVIIPIKKDYVDKIKEIPIKEHISLNLDNYHYSVESDLMVFKTDNSQLNNIKPLIGIECKAYTENAMYKRVLVDFSLLKSIYPEMKFVLLQLESQLGGDYSQLNNITFGSPSTHTLQW